jgi:putative transposase
MSKRPMGKLTYKYRLKGKRSERLLRRYAWAANQVWNFCVATQRTVARRWRDGATTRWHTQFDLQSLTKGTSYDLGLHAQSVQSVCEQFVKSRDQHRRCPRFRRSGGPRRSLGWVPFQRQSRQIDCSSVTYLGHVFRFFGAKRRPLPSTAKGGCFVEDGMGRWWVCFHVEVADDRPTGSGATGIDLGLKYLAVTSDGKKIESLRAYRTWESKLATAQRAGNRRRVSALHTKIANVRHDYLHKATCRIARENSFIAVGNVSASRLAKTRMAKSVFDAGWSMFRNMLRYKASRHGATYLEVDECFTTQTCSSCGALPPERPKGIAGLGVREWRCSSCGAIHDRDVNAARNILALALSAQRPVEGKPGSRGLDWAGVRTRSIQLAK